MNIRSQLEWALGLHAYDEATLSRQTFAEFYFLITEFLGTLRMTPSHIAAEGNRYSGKLEKFGGTATKRLVESGFDGVSVLSISVGPKDSKEPAFDRLISANLAWTAPSELLLCLAVNDASAQFLDAEFEWVLKKLLEWRPWAFGFALRDEVSRQPDFHVLTLDNGKLSKEERQALTRWYAARAEERLIRPRSVYSVNILNKQQQSRLVGDRTLGDFIRSQLSTSIEEIGELTVWKVAESEVESLRAELGAMGALISVP